MRSLLVLLILSSQIWAQSSCLEAWTNEPPFYVYIPSDTTREYVFTGNKASKTGILTPKQTTVGRAHATNSKDSPYKIIRRNTTVKSLGELPQNPSVSLVPVEILSEPQDQLDGLIGVNQNDQNNSLVKKKEKGFISPNSLKKISNTDVLMVTSDTVMLKDLNNSTSLVLKYGEGLKAIKNENQYKTLNCDGKISYVFEVTSSSAENDKKQVLLEDFGCFEQQLLSTSNYNNVTKLLNHLSTNNVATQIEVNEWGLSRLKFSPDDSFVHFTGTDREKTDDWATPDALCSFIDVARDWKKVCSGAGCTLQIGDMGFPSPTKMANGKDALGHLQHADGSCMDMRPFRKDQTMEGVNLDHYPEDYDHERTQNFVNLLLKAGATPVYFNDSKIAKNSLPGRTRQACDLANPKNDEKKGVFKCEGHSNHLHFCFRKPHVKGCG